MVSTGFDNLAQAAFASSEAIFTINSPSSHPSRAIDRLSDKYTISNTSPAVTTLQANADPFQKIQDSAANNKELTSVLATSDSLLAAIPHLFKTASQRSAVVVHVETKERDSDNSSTQHITGTAPTKSGSAGHSGVVPSYADLMAVRQTGFAVLTSDNAQAAFDLALVAQAAAVQTSTPFLNAVNGSAGASSAKQIILDHQRVAPALVSEQDLAAHRERQAAISEISLSSLYLKPQQEGQAVADSTATAAAASTEEVYHKVEELLAVLQKQTGRSYRPIEYQGKFSSLNDRSFIGKIRLNEMMANSSFSLLISRLVHFVLLSVLYFMTVKE